MKQINHWIGGSAVAGTSGRTGPVWNPATGEQQAEVDLASRRRGRRRGRRRRRPPSRRGGRRRCRAGPRSCSASASWSTPTARRSPRCSPPSTARCSATRSARWPAGSRTSSSPCGVPHLLKGGYSEQASSGVDVYSIRQPLGVVAGITPFNFPAMVPMWMFANAIACGNTFVLKPSREGPVGRRCSSPSCCAQAGLPDGVFNVVQGDKVAVDRLLEHPDVAAVSFVGSTPIARLHLRDRHPARQAGAGARRGQEPHGRAARRRHRHGRRRRGQRRLRLGRRALHGDLRRGRRRRRRRPARRRHPGADPQARASAPAPIPTARWARSSPASTATRWPATSTGAGGRRRRSSSTAASSTSTATASSSARRWSTTSTADMTLLPRRDLRPRAVGGAGRHLRRGAARSSTTTRTATAPPSSPATAARPASSSSTCNVGMVGINVPIPVPVATTASAAGRPRCSATTHMYGPEGIQFYTRAKVVTSPLARPGHVVGRPRLPAGALTMRMDIRASSCRRRRPRGGSSSWPSRPSSPASATCGRSTRTSCGRSRSSSTARSWPTTRNVIVGPDGHQPGHPRLDRHRVAVRHAQRDVRQPHGLRHRPRATRPCGSPTASPTTLATLREAIAGHPRARQRRQRRLQGLDASASRGRAKSRLEVWVAAYGPKALAADRRGRRRLHPAAGRPRHRGVDDQGGAGRGRGGRPRPGRGEDLRRRARLRRRRPRAPARPVPLVRRHGRQPRRRHRRALRRATRAVPTALTDYIKGRRGLRLQRARPGRQHPHRVRARRDRRPLLHPRPGRGAHRAARRAAGRWASTSSRCTCSTTPRTRRSQAYGEHVIPAVAEHVAGEVVMPASRSGAPWRRAVMFVLRSSLRRCGRSTSRRPGRTAGRCSACGSCRAPTTRRCRTCGTMLARFGDPEAARRRPAGRAQVVLGGAWFTFRLAAAGFVLGRVVGLRWPS